MGDVTNVQSGEILSSRSDRLAVGEARAHPGRVVKREQHQASFLDVVYTYLKG